MNLKKPLSIIELFNKNENLITNLLLKLKNKTIIHVSREISSLRYCYKVYQIKKIKFKIYENI